MTSPTSPVGAAAGAAPTWPRVLASLVSRSDLDAATAEWAMDEIMSGAAGPAQVAAFLVLLRAKGETVDELAGLAEGMLAHARPIDVTGDVLDIVGTGGDMANTVNISTMSCLVAAGAGAVVVKHGNRAVSSRSGTADVIEALGVSLDVTPARAVELAGEVGMSFLFAASVHPAMANAAAPRRELGIPTTFNLLGPLSNPAHPRYSLIGCADATAAPLMAGVLARRPVRAAVVRGRDGLDEVTVAAPTDVWWVQDNAVRHEELDPARHGFDRHGLDSLRGGDPAHNAQVVLQLLDGQTGPVRDAVLLNAGLALAVTGEDDGDLDELLDAGIEQARRAIDDGAAAGVLDRWREASHR